MSIQNKESPAPGDQTGDGTKEQRGRSSTHHEEPPQGIAASDPTSAVVSDEEREALQVARELIRAGVSIFRASPAIGPDGAWDPTGGTGSTGYNLPTGWQQTAPDEAVIDAWRPGDALALVCGGPLDTIDVDPRHSGDASHASLASAGMLPTCIGRQSTPSDGQHDLVNHLGVRSLDGTLPGLDVKAGHEGRGVGFVFLAPTRKLSKLTGEIGTYRWVNAPDVEEIDPADDSGAALAAIINDKRAATPGGRRETPPDYTGPVFAEMPPEEQRRLTAWTDAKKKRRKADITTVLDVPDGQKPTWQKTTADEAFHWQVLALMPWSPVAWEQAHEAYLSIVPQAMKDAERIDAEAIWQAQKPLALAKQSTHALRFPEDPNAAAKQLDAKGDIAAKGDGKATREARNSGDVAHVAHVADPQEKGGEAPREPVNGAELLERLETFVRRFCVLPTPAAYVAVTLWAAHTHFMDHMDSSGRLAALSPEPSSGKTRVLEVLDVLTFNPLYALDLSMSAFFRIVNDSRPTVLLDEVDAIFTGKSKSESTEDLRRVINNGYRVGAVVQRVGGQNRDQVQSFTVFAPVAMAGLGNLPDTLMSRSIILNMKRRAPGERVEPWRDRIHRPEGAELQAALTAWAETVDYMSYPSLPDGVEDRDADVWEPLLMVAEEGGGGWPERARAACLDFVNNKPASTVSLGVRLLTDLRSIWPATQPVMSTADILAELSEMDEAPWADLYGEGLTSRKLSNLLSGYGASSKDVRTPFGTRKGYRREDLWDAWQRYVPTVDTTDSEPAPSPSPQKGDMGDMGDIPGIPGPQRATSAATTATERATTVPVSSDAAVGPCPTCGGQLSSLRAAAGLDCVACYRKGVA